MDSIVIIGASGHARVVIDIVERQGLYRIAGLLDRSSGGQSDDGATRVCGYEVLGNEDQLLQLTMRHRFGAGLVAIADNMVRSRVVERIRAICPDFEFATAIHPKASIARGVSIGEGTVLMAGAVVNTNCSIGRFCIVNTNASLDHDSTMGDFSSLAPRVATGGNCHLGAHSAVGIGATLLHGLTIGEHSVVGAGSLVLKSLESRVVAYGSPARVIRSRHPGDRYL